MRLILDTLRYIWFCDGYEVVSVYQSVFSHASIYATIWWLSSLYPCVIFSHIYIFRYDGFKLLYVYPRVAYFIMVDMNSQVYLSGRYNDANIVFFVITLRLQMHIYVFCIVVPNNFTAPIGIIGICVYSHAAYSHSHTLYVNLWWLNESRCTHVFYIVMLPYSITLLWL